mmetsp:Transcript_47784/g.121922  ORF Transcript_47784/g.121922 Transcript_47784/m.121922 type:complete len:316 (+) Transcript_47784:246-1193(+)|eukprot:jgi/Tetstr1/457189/TSEL_043838.t1
MPPRPPPPNTSLFSGFTRLSKLLAVVVLALYVTAKVSPPSTTYLALVPGRTIPCVWNILTSQFLETHGALVALDIFAVLFLSKIIEPIYGSKEYLKYTLVVSTMAGVCGFTSLILAYMFGPRLGFILYGKYCGFQALLGAYLVAVKQIMPDSELRLLFVLKLKATYLPGIYLLLTCAIAGVNESYYTLCAVVSGTYFSWLYLRFFQKKMDGKLVGDPSDEFRFATFFPEIVRPAVDKVSGILGCCCASKQANASGYVLDGQPLPGSDQKESNRRRERGARALEERLSATAGDVEAPAKDGTTAEEGQVKPANGEK